MNMDKDISRMGLQNLQVSNNTNNTNNNNNNLLNFCKYIARATAASNRGFYIE